MSNGYTTIELGGQSVGLKFDYLAVKVFTKATIDKMDLYFTEVTTEEGKDQALTIHGVAKLFHSAYVSNCERKEVKPEIQYESFFDYVESLNDSDVTLDHEELSRVLQVYTECSYSKKLIEADKQKKSQLTTETIP